MHVPPTDTHCVLATEPHPYGLAAARVSDIDYDLLVTETAIAFLSVSVLHDLTAIEDRQDVVLTLPRALSARTSRRPRCHTGAVPRAGAHGHAKPVAVRVAHKPRVRAVLVIHLLHP